MKSINILRAIAISAVLVLSQTSFAKKQSRKIDNNPVVLQVVSPEESDALESAANEIINEARQQLFTGEMTPAEFISVVKEENTAIAQAEEEIDEDKAAQEGYWSSLTAPLRSGYGYTEEEKAVARQIITGLKEQLKEIDKEHFRRIREDLTSEELPQRSVDYNYQKTKEEIEQEIYQQQLITGEAMSRNRKLLWTGLALGGAAAGAALASQYMAPAVVSSLNNGLPSMEQNQQPTVTTQPEIVPTQSMSAAPETITSEKPMPEISMADFGVGERLEEAPVENIVTVSEQELGTEGAEYLGTPEAREELRAQIKESTQEAISTASEQELGTEGAEYLGTPESREELRATLSEGIKTGKEKLTESTQEVITASEQELGTPDAEYLGTPEAREELRAQIKASTQEAISTASEQELGTPGAEYLGTPEAREELRAQIKASTQEAISTASEQELGTEGAEYLGTPESREELRAQIKASTQEAISTASEQELGTPGAEYLGTPEAREELRAQVKESLSEKNAPSKMEREWTAQYAAEEAQRAADEAAGKPKKLTAQERAAELEKLIDMKRQEKKLNQQVKVALDESSAKTKKLNQLEKELAKAENAYVPSWVTGRRSVEAIRQEIDQARQEVALAQQNEQEKSGQLAELQREIKEKPLSVRGRAEVGVARQEKREKREQLNALKTEKNALVTEIKSAREEQNAINKELTGLEKEKVAAQKKSRFSLRRHRDVEDIEADIMNSQQELDRAEQKKNEKQVRLSELNKEIKTATSR